MNKQKENKYKPEKVNLFNQTLLYLLFCMVSIFLFIGAITFLVEKSFELNLFQLWLFAFIYIISMMFLMYLFFKKVHGLFILPIGFILLSHVINFELAGVLYFCSMALFVACIIHYVIIDYYKSKGVKK